MRHIKQALIGAGLLGLATIASAGTGEDWLQQQARPDGSFAGATALATPLVATAEAVRSLRALGHGDELAAAESFINADTWHATRHLAHRIIANIQAGTAVPEFLTELRAHQNPDGGFGARPGHASTALDSAAAIEVLAIAGQPGEAADAVQYLLDSQNADGGWGDASNGTRIETTALVLRALAYYRERFAFEDALQRGAQLLYARRGADDLWGEDFVSALAVLALTASRDDFSALNASVVALRAHQSADGSFGADVYSTALALRALLRFEQRAAHALGDAGSVDGFVSADGAPLAGATLDVIGAAHASATSDADGYFQLGSVPSGLQTVTARLAGYRAAARVVEVPAGERAALGTLSLYAQDDPAAPATLTVIGEVRDGLGGTPLSGASISGPAGSTLSDGDGRFRLEGLSILDFSLEVSADGVATQAFPLSAPAYGEFAATLTLPHPGQATATATSLSGAVTSSADGAPVGGATLQILDSGPQAVSDAGGAYALTGIDRTRFHLSVSAPGFTPRQLPVDLAAHGDFRLDVTLEPTSAGADVQIVSLDTLTGPQGAESLHRFRATIANLGDAAITVDAAGIMRDETSAAIARLTPIDPVTQSPRGSFDLAPGASAELLLQWNTAQWPPGEYRQRLRLSEAGTRSTELPQGLVLTEAESVAQVIGSRALGGRLDLSPPVTQAGEAVQLEAVLLNRGNVDLAGTELLMEIRDLDGGLRHSAQVTTPALRPTGFEIVAFGEWTPPEAGHFEIAIRAQDGAVAGEIEGTLYAGAHPAGSFSVDRSVVPSGDATVRGTLSLAAESAEGRSLGGPRYVAIQEAVRTGAEHLVSEARAFQGSYYCLGCHVQTQALYGVATARAKGGEVSAEDEAWLAGTIASAQRSAGRIYNHLGSHMYTQTLLGAWSLSARADKAPDFRTRYRAVSLLHDNRGDCRNDHGATWTPDRLTCWGGSRGSWSWIDSYAGLAMMAASSYADLLRSADEVDLSQIVDYRLENLRGAGGVCCSFMKLTADLEQPRPGVFYNLQVQTPSRVEDDGVGGAIVTRYDTATGTSTVFGIPGTPATVIGMAVGADETIYLSTSDGRVLVADPDRNVSLLYTDPDAGYFADIDLGPDGALYLSDRSGHRLLRLSADGEGEVLRQGAPLNGPHGIEFTPSGSLLVVNWGSDNVVERLADGSFTELVSGLSYPPLHAARTADGDLYITHDSSRPGRAQERAGMYRVHADGTVERTIATVYTMNGIQIVNGQVVAGRSTPFGSDINVLSQTPLNTGRLDAFRAELPYLARTLLTYHHFADHNHLNEALRMIGLGQLRDLITDPALQAEIDDRITSLAATLRSRQHADGGWNLHNDEQPSDALVTAYVGLALDVTEPAKDDPVFLAALDFLLATQRPDHTWISSNHVLETPYSATAAVMAWLPTAIEKLGGIDTELHLHLPADITLNNPDRAPDAGTVGPDGGADYRWRLERLDGTAQSISFDLTLADLQLHEERPVATTAVLESTNAFTGEALRVALDIPTVRAHDGVALGLATDRGRYAAHQTVQLSAPVSNAGTRAASGSVGLRIIATADNALVAELPPQDFADLAAGGQQLLSFDWPTGTTRAGGYLAQATLHDDAGLFVDAAEAGFEIAAAEDGAALASVRAGTDRAMYHTTDGVQIHSLARNLSSNQAIVDARLRVQVFGPAGSLLLADDQALGELAPQAMAERHLSQTLSGAAEGRYRIHSTLLDGAGQTLASDTTDYTVREDREQSITGSVQAEARSLAQGDTQTCTDTVRNSGTLAAEGLALRQLLVRLDVDTLISTSESGVDLAPDASHRLVRAFGTGPLEVGDYACVLQARLEGDWKNLAHAAFAVTEPPIRIDATLSLGDKGRLLVLLDPPSGDGDVRDPLGPDVAPDLDAQRGYLESLLEAEGWSYTIVTQADAFTAALRSGAYGVYAVLSETVKLGESVQVELREAVYRGEGLLEAGSHDQRNHTLDEALGLSFAGRHARAAGVEFLPGPLSGGGYADYPVADKTLRARLEGAESQATVTGGPAVTSHDYGAGRGVYAGFDLLVQATAAGGPSRFKELLQRAPIYAQPPLDPLKTDRVVPLRLQLVNEGITVSGQVLITLPPGAAVADAGQARIGDGGTLIWSYSLAEDETATLAAWLRLPSEAGPATVSAVVQVERDEALHEHARTELVLEVSVTGGLDQALDALRAVSASGRNQAAYRKVERELEAAQADIEAGDPLLALEALVRAATDLARLDHPDAPPIRAMVAEALYQVGAML